MVCKNCGNEIALLSKRGRKKKFCSEDCRRQWWSENPDASAKASYTKLCHNCGELYTSFNIKAKCCSNRCSGETKKNKSSSQVIKKVCSHCGCAFTTTSKNQNTCSKKCSLEAGHEKLKKYYDCDYCGEKFSKRNAYRMKYCSRKCSVEGKHGTVSERLAIKKAEQQAKIKKITCSFCGIDFKTNMSTQIYCSEDCRYKSFLSKSREKILEEFVPKEFICKECRANVITEYGRPLSLYCSKECGDKHLKKKYAKKRKMQMRKAYKEVVSFKRLFLRDKGICGICGMPVALDKRHDDSWGATIDHILPLSKGGMHEMKNCQLAHRLCNSLKLDTTESFNIDWKVKNTEDGGRWTEQLHEYNKTDERLEAKMPGGMGKK